MIAGGLFDKHIDLPYILGAIILLATLFLTGDSPKSKKERIAVHD